MPNIFERTGKVALGSRLRLLTNRITEDSGKLYELYGVEGFSPKWFPVFFVLAVDGEKTITEIANEIGHSQPSVTKIIKEMTESGLVQNNPNALDKRQNVVFLTEKGLALVEKIDLQCTDIDITIEGLINEATHNLWQAISEWELLLEQKTLFSRVQEQKRIRESKHVKIVDYDPQYHAAFKNLNEEWISTYFELEDVDRKVLDHPDDYILKKGGEILVALYNEEPLGVCALLKMDDPDYDYELSKVAVSPKAQGKNIGLLMIQAAIEKAKELGASKLFLESNTKLKAAVHLFQKVGFKIIPGRSSSYKRADVQMDLDLFPIR